MARINRYVIHAISEGNPHTEVWDCYSRGQAVQLFTVATLFSDTVINEVEELGPVDNLTDWVHPLMKA